MTTEPDRDPLLFTPGPLTTSLTVKRAMLHDAGSRDARFVETVRRIRERLLALGGVSKEAGYEAVLMQGSGTFGLESVVSSVIPPGGKLLVLVNGAYGRRIAEMARRLKIETESMIWGEAEPVAAAAVSEALARDSRVTHVAVVHCETTTGILNPVAAVGGVVAEAKRTFIVDAMSSFGGVLLRLDEARIDYLISSSNKCIEGVPGFSLILARRAVLEGTAGWARSLSLDLLAQWQGLEKSGQFRFTPPTHALLAFKQALTELEAEGGVAGRAARYRGNHEVLVSGLTALGLKPYLDPEVQSDIITAFHYPEGDWFDFEEFYGRLAEKGLIIYPGKLSEVDCFRVGSIGRLGTGDMEELVAAVGEVLGEMRSGGV